MSARKLSSGFTNDAGGELYLHSTANLIVNTSLINNGTAYFAETGNKTISGSAAFVNNGSFIHRDTSGTDNLQLSAEVGWISDRNFLEQYLEREWDEQKDQTTGVELKQATDNHSWSITADARVNSHMSR